MRAALRSLVALILAIGIAAQTTAVALGVNTTALIMGGTLHPLTGPRDNPSFVTTYLDSAVSSHLDPAFGATYGPVTNAVAVFTPEDFFPLGRLTLDRSVAEGATNLRHCLTATPECVYNSDPAVTPAAGTAAPQLGDTMLVFGYSQSAVIASLVKADLIDEYQAGDPTVAFDLVANPMRPNGGVLMRLHGWPTIPLLGISFPGASPTAGPTTDDGEFVYPTVDIAWQYDGMCGDFPVRPLNLIALANSIVSLGLQHSFAPYSPFTDARFQGQQGDTSYYMVDADLVPLLQPLELFVPKPILSALDVPLRVIIEDAYERGVGPGTPTPMRWWPVGDLGRLATNLLRSIPVAVDELFDGFGLGRPFGTTTPGPFGVGGPDIAELVESGAPQSESEEPDAECAGESTALGEPEAELSEVEVSEAEVTEVVTQPETPEPVDSELPEPEPVADSELPEPTTETELSEMEPVTEVELAVEPDVEGAESDEDPGDTAADPDESEAPAEADVAA